MGLTFAIIILALTFVLTWSARHHDRRQARHDHELADLDTPEPDDPLHQR